MKVLVVGSGGREHAMCRALATDPKADLLIAPGNPGTATLGRNLAVTAADIAGVVAAARGEQVDLVIPGPELPLTRGLSDALAADGIACCGPSAAAARLEGSKVFTRRLTEAAGVPSPRYRIVTDGKDIAAAMAVFASPPVVKADGLAGGKGVFLPDDEESCAAEVRGLLGGRLGAAGSRVVLEEHLVGVEASLFWLCHGTRIVPLPHARDYKRIGDGDRGPNTGGMGAVSPNPAIDPVLEKTVRENIILPVLHLLQAEGIPFVGFLYAGLMLTTSGPKLLEFNVRLGDPEAQAVLPRLEDGVFGDVCRWAACGGKGEPDVWIDPRSTCAVVLAADGYPKQPCLGDPITIDDKLPGPDRWFIHAATRWVDGALVSAGGRVGAVVARAETAEDARRLSYGGTELVEWGHKILRSDIGLSSGAARWGGLPDG